MCALDAPASGAHGHRAWTRANATHGQMAGEPPLTFPYPANDKLPGSPHRQIMCRSYGSPHGLDGGDELMMSRGRATMTGVLVAALTVVGGVAGTRVISVGPSAAPDTSAAAVAKAANALGPPQAGKIRSIASGAPSSAAPTSYSPPQSAAPQASYSQAAPVAATATS